MVAGPALSAARVRCLAGAAAPTARGGLRVVTYNVLVRGCACFDWG